MDAIEALSFLFMLGNLEIGRVRLFLPSFQTLPPEAEG